MAGAAGDHISQLCRGTWNEYGLPAAVAARDLLLEALGVVGETRDRAAETPGADAAGPDRAAGLLERRLNEFDRALTRMTGWIQQRREAEAQAPAEGEAEAPTRLDDAEEGVRAFDGWHGAYHAAIGALILCDACGQLRLEGSRLGASYATWKHAHKILRAVLDGCLETDMTLSGPLVNLLPFRRQLAEAGERTPLHYLVSAADRQTATDIGGTEQMVPCFLNGVRTQFIREALRGLEEDLPEESRVRPVREALERLRASDCLSPYQLEVLETFVAELEGDAEPARSWTLQQRLKSIERDLATQP